MRAIRINISFSFSFSSICSIGTSSREITHQPAAVAKGPRLAQFQDALQAQLRYTVTSITLPRNNRSCRMRSACPATHRRWKESALCGHDDLWAECQTSMTTTVQQVLDGDKKRIVSTLSGSRFASEVPAYERERRWSSTGWQCKSWRGDPSCCGMSKEPTSSRFDQFGRPPFVHWDLST